MKIASMEGMEYHGPEVMFGRLAPGDYFVVPVGLGDYAEFEKLLEAVIGEGAFRRNTNAVCKRTGFTQFFFDECLCIPGIKLIRDA